MGGASKMLPSMGGGQWIFSGITHSQKVKIGLVTTKINDDWYNL